MNNPEGVDGNLTYSGLNSLIWDSLLVLGDVFFEIAKDKTYNTFAGFKYIHNNKIKWSSENDCYQLIDQPDVLFEEDDLIHISRPNQNFTEQHRGTSLVDSCAEYIALQMNAVKYNNNILNNNGLSPDTILSYDNDISDANFNSEVQRLQVMKDEADKTGGMLVTRGATFQTASNTNKDMNYLELMKFCRDNIIQNFGIPPQIYGIVETAHLGSGTAHHGSPRSPLRPLLCQGSLSAPHLWLRLGVLQFCLYGKCGGERVLS
jgi:HK97 family phage portal protein